MTRLANLVHRDEFPDVRKDFEKANPVKTRKPFKPAYPGVSGAALAWMRAQDTSWATAGRRPVAAPSATYPAHDHGATPPAPRRPLPSRDLIERLTAVSTAMQDDYTAHLDALAVLDGIAAAIADGADAHAVRMALAPIAAELAALAPVATMKAQVA